MTEQPNTGAKQMLTEQDYSYCKRKLLTAFAIGGKPQKRECILTLINHFPEQDIYDLDSELTENGSYRGQ